MKHLRSILFLFALAFTTSRLFAQTALERYFNDEGVYHLCQAAHASNDYLSGSYDIYPGYVDVSLTSKDNIFGVKIYTDIRVVRGAGDLYFSDLKVLHDDDMVKPFEAFGLQAVMVTELIKTVDQPTYKKIRSSIIQQFDTDFEHWTGKMWALLAINLDYYEFMLSGK